MNRLAAYFLALAAFWSSFPVFAVSLGEARVLSYLGQPLHVEIPLPGATEASVSAIRIRIGNEADFDRLALGYDYQVANLPVQIVRRGNQWFAEIRSRDIFNQPIVEFPLSLRGDQGTRMVKAYTLLLDPPNYVVVTPAAVASREPAPQPLTDEYRVRRGDTLWPIAQRVKPAGVTTQQMMMALLRENPHAFIDNNINRLRANVVLRVPANDTLAASNPVQARAEVDQQMDQWRSTPPASQAPAQAAPEEAPATQDQLRVLSQDVLEEAASEDSLEQQVLLTHEEMEKTRLEQQELREQISTLRDELDHMQRLINLKDEQIATLQSIVSAQQAATEQPQEAAPATVAPEAVEGALPQADAGLQAPQDALPAEQDPAAAEAIAEQPLPAEEAAAEAAAPEETAETESIPQTRETMTPAATPVQQPTQQWVVPWWWLPVGVGVVLLGVLLLRRRSTPDPEHETPLAELPTIVNAPPPPYSAAAHKTEHPAEDGEPGKSAPTPAKTDRRVEEHDAVDESSLLDEPLSELGSLPDEQDSRQSGESQFVIDNTPLPGEPVEMPMSEDELAELAKALDSDAEQELEQDLQLPLGGENLGGDDSIDRFWSTLDEQPVGQAPDASASSDSDDEDIIIDMARAYLELGDREAALDMLEQLLEKTDNPEQQARIQELIEQAQ